MSSELGSERFWKTPNTLDAEPELLEEEVEESREAHERAAADTADQEEQVAQRE